MDAAVAKAIEEAQTTAARQAEVAMAEAADAQAAAVNKTLAEAEAEVAARRAEAAELHDRVAIERASLLQQIEGGAEQESAAREPGWGLMRLVVM